ncbi:MAG: hypothetical protein IKB38_06630 [Clostridia bacterium]|nr:hypothetical protein [Clostridia bacterium]
MKKHVITLTAFIFAIACALNIFTEPVLALASVSTGVYADGSEDPYKSPEGSSDTVTLSSSELLRLFVGDPLSDAELACAERMSTLTFSYSKNISLDGVRVVAPRGSSELFVYANDTYADETQSGVFVEWKPISVSSGTSSAEFSDADGEEGYSYLARLSYDGECEEIYITYEASFAFSAEVVNELSNLAYKAALAASDRIAEGNRAYELLLADYRERLSAHEQYLLDLAEYESALVLYEQYVEECDRINASYEAAMQDYYELLSQYEELKAEYEPKKAEHEAALAEYEKKLAEYETYINVTKPEYDKAYNEYLAYLVALEEYEELCEKRAVYEADSPKFLKHLEIINVAKTEMTDHRTLYGALMGNMVEQVLDRQDEIVAGGAPRELVRIASLATKKLKILYEEYFKLTSDAERYEYYKKYYKDFKTNIINLLQALDRFYTMNGGNGIVYTKLADEEKAKKYVILLSQLYVVATALSDEKVYTYGGTAEFTDDYTWTYALNLSDLQAGKIETVTPISMLEGKRYLGDVTSAAPYTEEFPEYVDVPVKPTEVLKPEPVTKVSKPVEPTPLPELDPPPTVPEEPVMPTPVEKPEQPTLVEHPGEEPSPYVPTPEDSELAEALKTGDIVCREERDTELSVTLDQTVSRDFSSNDGAVVYFYSSKEGGELLDYDIVGIGESATFDAQTPKKPSDDEYHYAFSHWIDEDGNAASLDALEAGHVHLYPAYKSFGKNETFTVTWNVNGEFTETFCKYGEIPSYGSVPAKPKDGTYSYVFSSWDKEITPVVGEVTYTAVFSAVKYYKITWLANGEVFAVTDCNEGEVPSAPDVLPERPEDDFGVYSFAGWDRALESAHGDSSYEARFDVTRYYKITWVVDGQTVAQTKCLETQTPVCPIASPVRPEDEVGVYTFSGWDKPLTPPTSDTVYEALFDVTRYREISWTVDGKVIAVTRCLDGQIPIPPAQAPTKPDDDYGRYTFSGWGELLPCSADTSYEARFDVRRYYQISWSADGSVLLSTKCLEGEIPAPPSVIPVKPDDDYGRYTFSGWGELLPCSADTSYEACFDVERYYKITWTVDGQVLASVKCLEGEIPVPPTDAPSKPDDAYGRYTFSGWGEVLPVTCDTSYEARFDVVRYMKIEWRLEGQSVAVTYCLENEVPASPFEIGDSLYDDGEFRYLLLGWDRELTAPSSDEFYEARFEKTKYFKIDWVVNGKLAATTYCVRGQIPQAPITELVSAEDGRYKYVITGWDRELEIPTDDTSYHAEYVLKRFYTVEWYKRGELVLASECFEGEIPTAPTLPAEENVGDVKYIFLGWNKPIGALSSDTEYEALFEQIRYYTVTWLVNGTVFATTRCAENEIPTPPSGIPTRAEDDFGVYTFKDWGGALECPDSDTSYEARFDVLRYYKIEWCVGGVVMATMKCLETDVPVCPITSPVKPEDDFGVYTFVGWDKEIVPPVSDTRYTAIFDVTRYYKIEWVADGEVIAVSECLETQVPTCPIKDPVFKDDGAYRYIIISWDRAFEKPTSDTSYTAVVKKTDLYKIDWIVDGEVYVSAECKRGEIPKCPVPEYFRPEGENYKYVIIGWDRAFEPAEFDTSYEAEFVKKYFYKIEWRVNGEVYAVTECCEDSRPEPPTKSPSMKNDEFYKYTFVGWGKIDECPANDTYYEAEFEKDFVYPCGNGGASVTLSYGRLTLDISACGTDTIEDLPLLSELAQGRRVTVKNQNWTLYFEAENLIALIENGVFSATVLAEVTEGVGTYSFVFADEIGNGLEASEGYVSRAEFSLDGLAEAVNGGEISLVAVLPDGTSERRGFSYGVDNFSIASPLCNVIYKYIEVFEVNSPSAQAGVSFKNEAIAGERVEFSVEIPEGKTVSSLYYVVEGAENVKVPINGSSFVMPEGNVWLFATLKPLEFSVTFVFYDGTSKTVNCAWGEIPSAPSVPRGMKADKVYTFIGWDKELDAAYSDSVYTALYEIEVIDGESDQKGDFWLLLLILLFRFRVLLIISLAVSVLSAVAFVIYRIYRKKHPIS